MERIWALRKSRLEGRLYSKTNEYDARRGVLTKEYNEIRESIIKDKEHGLPENRGHMLQMERIRDRMDRLADLAHNQELDMIKIRDGQLDEVEEKAPPAICQYCEVKAPEDHPNPTMWVRGHQITCKAKQVSVAV